MDNLSLEKYWIQFLRWEEQNPYASGKCFGDWKFVSARGNAKSDRDHQPFNKHGKVISKKSKHLQEKKRENKEDVLFVTQITICRDDILKTQTMIKTIRSLKERKYPGNNMNNNRQATGSMRTMEMRVSLNHQPSQITPIKSSWNKISSTRKCRMEVLSGLSMERNLKHRGRSRNMALKWYLEIELLAGVHRT